MNVPAIVLTSMAPLATSARLALTLVENQSMLPVAA
jgi:hypothetical protein